MRLWRAKAGADLNDKERTLHKIAEQEGMEAQTAQVLIILCVPFSAVGRRGNGKNLTMFTDYRTLPSPLSRSILI